VPHFSDVPVGNDDRLIRTEHADGIQSEEVGRGPGNIGLDRMPGFDDVRADNLSAAWIKKDQLTIMTQDKPTSRVDPVDPIDTGL